MPDSFQYIQPTYLIVDQMMLLKIILFLNFHKHHIVAIQTVLMAEFLLLETQNLATNS